MSAIIYAQTNWRHHANTKCHNIIINLTPSVLRYSKNNMAYPYGFRLTVHFLILRKVRVCSGDDDAYIAYAVIGLVVLLF
jgi:hypothetical protein